MVNVCDMSNFPKQKYFQQHEIPQWGPPEYTYEYTRGLIVRLEPVFDSESNYVGVSAKMEDAFKSEISPGVYRPGVRYRDKKWPEVVLDLFAVPALRSKFDFSLWNTSRIAIRLEDELWAFSKDLSPFTTKFNYDGHYFDLLLHRLDGAKLISKTESQWRLTEKLPCRCISFFARQPCRDVDLGGPEVRHGFSLNVDLFEPKPDGSIDYDKPLPITIDPDIENKGGNP